MDCSRIALILACFYFTADCLNFPGGGERGLSGISFGGRLLVANQDGRSHQWDTRKAFIFSSPKRGGASLGGHGGRGVILIRKSQTCRGPTTQQHSSCPARGNVPCMDSTIPCSFDFGPSPAPSYTKRAPLIQTAAVPGEVIITRPQWNESHDIGAGPVKAWTLMIVVGNDDAQNVTKAGDNHVHVFRYSAGTKFKIRIALMNADGEVGLFTDWQSFTVPCPDPRMSLSLRTSSKKNGNAKVQAAWDYQTLSEGCAVRNQTIRFKQLDIDHCVPEETDVLDDVFRIVNISSNFFRRPSLQPNSLFNVTVTVVTKTNQEFQITETIRTAATAPTGLPVIGPPIDAPRGRKRFTWSALPCGERNSDTLKYEYIITVKGKSPFRLSEVPETIDTDMQTQPTKSRVRPGQLYKFRVRAYSDEGHGTYNERNGRF